MFSCYVLMAYAFSTICMLPLICVICGTQVENNAHHHNVAVSVPLIGEGCCYQLSKCWYGGQCAQKGTLLLQLCLIKCQKNVIL